MEPESTTKRSPTEFNAGSPGENRGDFAGAVDDGAASGGGFGESGDCFNDAR